MECGQGTREDFVGCDELAAAGCMQSGGTETLSFSDVCVVGGRSLLTVDAWWYCREWCEGEGVVVVVAVAAVVVVVRTHCKDQYEKNLAEVCWRSVM